MQVSYFIPYLAFVAFAAAVPPIKISDKPATEIAADARSSDGCEETRLSALPSSASRVNPFARPQYRTSVAGQSMRVRPQQPYQMKDRIQTMLTTLLRGRMYTYQTATILHLVDLIKQFDLHLEVEFGYDDRLDAFLQKLRDEKIRSNVSFIPRPVNQVSIHKGRTVSQHNLYIDSTRGGIDSPYIAKVLFGNLLLLSDLSEQLRFIVNNADIIKYYKLQCVIKRDATSDENNTYRIALSFKNELEEAGLHEGYDYFLE